MLTRLFRKRGTGQGPVVEQTPKHDPWNFDRVANNIAANRPTENPNIQHQENTKLARRMEEKRKSHGSEAKY